MIRNNYNQMTKLQNLKQKFKAVFLENLFVGIANRCKTSEVLLQLTWE